MKVEKIGRGYRLQKEKESVSIMKNATKGKTRSIQDKCLVKILKAMILVVVVIATFFVFVHVDTATYVGIYDRRNQNAEALKWGTMDMESIEKNADQCARDLETLSARSSLGELLVKNDQTQMGHVYNYLIVYGSRIFVIICVCSFAVDGIDAIKLLVRKRGKYAQKLQNQPQTLDNQ